jgi:hypothetical protein
VRGGALSEHRNPRRAPGDAADRDELQTCTSLPMMRSTILILAAAVLPLLWGWVVHGIVDRFWPVAEPPRDERSHGVRSLEHPIDYQI